MNYIEKFLADNGLKQKDLAAFLKIGEPSVSKMVNGKSSPSPVNLRKLLDNEEGWDTTALQSMIVVEGDNFQLQNVDKVEINKAAKKDKTRQVEGNLKEEIAKLKAEVEKLKAQLKDEHERAERFLKVIENLTTK